MKIIFIDKEIEKDLVVRVVENLGIKIDKILVEKVPDCYNPLRNQYNAECLLDYFLSKYKSLVLIITDLDIYVEGLNFVFGLAYPFKGCVVSFYRLKTRDKNLYHSRIRKEIKHELGHVFGLKHCKLPCVMSFSNSIFEVDLKSENFCEKCEKKFKDNLKLFFDEKLVRDKIPEILERSGKRLEIRIEDDEEYWKFLKEKYY